MRRIVERVAELQGLRVQLGRTAEDAVKAEKGLGANVPTPTPGI